MRTQCKRGITHLSSARTCRALLKLCRPRLFKIIWLLHNLVEASFDLFRYLLLGDQLKPWELHPLVSYTSSMNLSLLWSTWHSQACLPALLHKSSHLRRILYHTYIQGPRPGPGPIPKQARKIPTNALHRTQPNIIVCNHCVRHVSECTHLEHNQIQLLSPDPQLSSLAHKCSHAWVRCDTWQLFPSVYACTYSGGAYDINIFSTSCSVQD